MGAFSVWHWLVFLFVIAELLLPIYFLIVQPAEPNRYGDVTQPMDFGQAIKAYWSNYFNFEGRASRSEFWWAVLFVFIVNIVVGFIPFVNLAWSLATLLPSLSLTVRRLHDINRSGWHVLLAFLFPIGTIALLIWQCTAPKDARVFGMYQGRTNGDLERIEKLMALKTSGAITDQEFEAQKRMILGR